MGINSGFRKLAMFGFKFWIKLNVLVRSDRSCMFEKQYTYHMHCITALPKNTQSQTINSCQYSKVYWLSSNIQELCLLRYLSALEFWNIDFEKLSLMNWNFCLVWNRFFTACVACKIRVWNRQKIYLVHQTRFFKLDISKS